MPSSQTDASRPVETAPLVETAPVDTAPPSTAHRLARAVGGKALAAVLVVWGAGTATFLALHAIKGDPVDIILGSDSVVQPAERDAIRSSYGLDQPVLLQYLSYLKRVFTGDLGRSYQLQRPVADVIGAELWPTVSLAVPAVVLAVVIACVLALTTAGRPRSRSWASSFELLSVSIPTFWIGILLLWVFAFTLGWFPASSAKTDASLVLPVVTLALPVAGLLSQVLRDGVEDALAQPFVLTAQARGASRARVLLVHAFRHALLPATTLTAYFVGATLGGAVLTETVFARPGLGRVTLAAIGSKDMPVVLGIVLLSALVFIVVNTVLDALYVVIDPRLRTTSRRRPGTAKEVPA